jgi:hypothetical protein
MLVAVLTIVVLVNFILDKNHVFRNTIKGCNPSGNERYSKIEYLERNFKQYDSYIIGGSRIGVIKPETVNKCFSHSHFYNLFTNICRINESELLIKYIANNYNVKNIILQLSLYDIGNLGISPQLHYKVTGENVISFFLKNLFDFNFFDKYNYLKLLKENPKALSLQPINCDGTWNYQLLEDSIAHNKPLYYKNWSKFSYSKHAMGGTLTDLTMKMTHLAAIKNICKQKNIRIIVCFIPENYTHLEMYSTDSYLDFIKAISQVTDFWDFSGYNSITLDDNNYYEMLHFRSFVGDMMMARIFNDTLITIPDDFGYFVTKENVADHIENLRNTINKHTTTSTTP